MPQTPAPTLALDELPNAATAPAWTCEDGTVVPPLGEAGVEALRRAFEDRILGDYRIPAGIAS